MSNRLLRPAAVSTAFLMFGLAGCGSTPTPVAEQPTDAPRPLGAVADVSLADLLGKPRAELAELADECLGRVRVQEKARRDGTLSFALTPQARLPLVIPVWQEAKFSQKAGFSLPPYLAEGTTDNELALHLARFGDTEAARRLADPKDAAVLKRIDACGFERNYPVEWTRLVALLVHAAEFRLATGDADGRAEL